MFSGMIAGWNWILSSNESQPQGWLFLCTKQTGLSEPNRTDTKEWFAKWVRLP
ncbi:hypothetical protein LEP1GSC202_2025 [Leptospira yanagawae serovar Saopaulo str. Sao Paulo = ATCC 700523]|uniref:Uncharacterized protein n=1 Tax=Leptospira yanagawae serovar Saopaulo str. Sao Paulo = ATCC 700523 TaxID=1249483 RepID=A0A5E8H907_9LEPT|nr:hypothetical protein LEP1GSC202_2025 [Leptospira yanagawae serovar Saopaulo str. Sao Paulo = ATCC 700523]